MNKKRIGSRAKREKEQEHEQEQGTRGHEDDKLQHLVHGQLLRPSLGVCRVKPWLGSGGGQGLAPGPPG